MRLGGVGEVEDMGGESLKVKYRIRIYRMGQTHLLFDLNSLLHDVYIIASARRDKLVV